MNISNLLANLLDSKQQSALRSIGGSAQSLGVRAFLVGGSVRDLILGRPVSDIDISVECRPEKLLKTPELKDSLLVSSSEFGTVKFNIHDELIDVAMARSEVYPEPGMLPEVRPSNIGNDLFRRDFTINSIAVSLSPENWGEVFDAFDSISDLRSKTIRVMHSKSFMDDPTRIFRAARYMVRLDFVLNLETQNLILGSLKSVRNLSGVRISNELSKIFLETDPGKVIRLLDSWGVMRCIYESLDTSLIDWDCLTIESSPQNDRDVIGFLFMALSLKSLKERGKFSQRMAFNSSVSKAIVDLSLIEDMKPNFKASDVYKTLSQCSESALASACLFHKGYIADHVDLYRDNLKHVRLSIDGNDIFDLGIGPGPQTGQILRSIHSSLLDGDNLSREEQIELAKTLIDFN